MALTVLCVPCSFDSGTPKQVYNGIGVVDGVDEWVPLSLTGKSQRERSLLTTYWSESTISS